MAADRIHVEISGDSGDLKRAAVSAAASLKALDRSATTLNRRFSGVSREVRLFSQTLRALKAPAALAAIAASLNTIAPAAIAAVGALGPLVGSLGALPGLLGAAIQGFTVAKLAVGDLGKAVGGLNEPLDETSKAFQRLSPEAQRFARTLHEMKPAMRDLQLTAQKGLFPGMEEGLKGAQRNLPVFRRIVAETSKELGSMARELGNWLGSAGVGKDLDTIGERNVVTLARFGDAGLNLADALRHVTIAAGPLVDWLTRLGVSWSEQAARSARAGRETGELAAYFERTRAILERLGSIFQSLGDGFAAIGRAGRVFGDDIWKSIDRAAQRFEDWTESAKGQNALRGWFENARNALNGAERAINKITERFRQLRREGRSSTDALAITISEAFSKALGRIVQTAASKADTVAEAFVKGFLAANTWGKLAIGTWLFARMGGAGAFRGVAAKMATTLGRALTRQIGKRVGVAAGEATAGNVAGAVASSFGGKLRRVAGKIRSALHRTLTRAGSSAGVGAASGAAESAAANIVGSARGGKLKGGFSRAGSIAGRTFGIVAAGAIIAAIVAWSDDIAKAFEEAVGFPKGRTDAQRDAGGIDANRDSFNPLQFLPKSLRPQKGGLITDRGVLRFASGGFVPGSGSGDRVPALLEPGEFVMRKKAVQAAGTQTLQKANKGAPGKGLADTLKGDAAKAKAPIAQIQQALAGVARAGTQAGQRAGVGLSKNLDTGTKKGVASARRLNKDGTKNFGDLRKGGEKETKRLGKTVDRGFLDMGRDVKRQTQRMGKDVDIRFGSMRVNVGRDTKRMNRDVDARFADMRAGIGRSTKRSLDATTSRFRQMRTRATASSKRMASAVASSMGSLDAAVFTGMSYIAEATNAALQVFDDKKSDKFSVPRPKGMPKGGGADGLAGGGYVGAPGQKGRDTVPAMLGQGEFVANRHQQGPIQEALAVTKAMGVGRFGSLQELASREKTPHYLARGGFAGVRGFAPGGFAWRGSGTPPSGGEKSRPILALARFLMSKGYSATSGGEYRGSGTMHDGQQAIDWSLSDGPGGGQGISRLLLPRKSYIAELFGPAAYMGLYNNGAKFSSAGLQADHEDHIHTGVSRMIKGLGLGGDIPKMRMQGPASAMLNIGQGALDMARDAARRKLDTISATGRGGGSSLKGLTGSVAEKMFGYIRRRGGTDSAAAGMIGNAAQESGGKTLQGITPNSVGGGGFGLFGFDYEGPFMEAYAQKHGKSKFDLKTQLDFTIGRLKGVYAPAWNQLNSAPNPTAATKVFFNTYEKAGIPEMETRISQAKAAWSAFHKKYGRGGFVGKARRFAPGGFVGPMTDREQVFQAAQRVKRLKRKWRAIRKGGVTKKERPAFRQVTSDLGIAKERLKTFRSRQRNQRRHHALPKKLIEKFTQGQDHVDDWDAQYQTFEQDLRTNAARRVLPADRGGGEQELTPLEVEQLISFKKNLSQMYQRQFERATEAKKKLTARLAYLKRMRNNYVRRIKAGVRRIRRLGTEEKGINRRMPRLKGTAKRRAKGRLRDIKRIRGGIHRAMKRIIGVDDPSKGDPKLKKLGDLAGEHEDSFLGDVVKQRTTAQEFLDDPIGPALKADGLPGQIAQQRFDIRSLRDEVKLPPREATSDTGATDQSALLDLTREQLRQSREQTRVSQSGFGVLRNFQPYLGRFAQGGQIDRTGMAMLHAGEYVIPSPDGPFNNRAAAGAAPQVTVVVNGDAAPLMRDVQVMVDGKLVQHNRNQGRTARRLAAAPGRR